MLEIIIRFHNIKSDMRNLNWYLIIFHKIIIFERAGRDVQYVLIELCFYLISWILMSSCFWEKKIRLDSQRQTFLIFIWIFFFEDGVLSCNSGDLLKISSFWNGVVSMNWRNTCKIPKYSNFCLTIRVKRWVSIFYFHCF